ncbi:MAG: sugar ABC transporter substrate-binding protein [Armatimonadetes bacterium RBG_19FT_COMBO_69_19]|nr:MAG: sugar ABC transporter substrate-binding protein [Armatimonadetes bacterium RBG_19FT_COMBO_69_19]
MRTPAVPVRLGGVTKRFGAVLAVDDVTLEIPAGLLVTLLGPSGCGKTTTLRMVAGLEHPTNGRVFIGDEDVTPLPASNRSVTMVFQSYALFPHLTVFENVAYGLRIAKVPERALREQVGAVLELVGLPQVGERYPAQLSGGQQQRVALARALVMKPKVLLFDEPLSNLDAKLRKRVRAEIRDLQQRLGITTIYVTHDQAEALALSDVIVVMNLGRVEQVGSPFDLYRKPATRFVADFIGEANLLPGRYAEGMVTVGPYTFAFRQDGVHAGPVTVVARPETVQVATAGQGLPGTVRSAFFMGTTIDYLIETPIGEVSASAPPRVTGMLPVGSDVRLQFAEAGLYLLTEDGR